MNVYERVSAMTDRELAYTAIFAGDALRMVIIEELQQRDERDAQSGRPRPPEPAHCAECFEGCPKCQPEQT